MFLPNFATLRNVIAAEIWLLARPHELALNHLDYIAAARHAILDLGSEDYYHLADATAYLPTVPAEHRHTVAREAMLQLVEQGFVELFFGELATNDMTPVPPAQVRAVLNNPSAWTGETTVSGLCGGRQVAAADARSVRPSAAALKEQAQ